MPLEQLLGTDKVSPTGKNKINSIVTKLQGGYSGQVLVSQGDGMTDPQWEDIPNPFYADTAGNAATADQADIAESISGGSYSVFKKVLPIGQWNMDTISEVTITSGISDISKIISVSAMIIIDDLTRSYPLITTALSGGNCDGYWWAETNSIILGRRTSGVFDGADFNSTGISRGWVVIEYIP